MYFPVWQLIHVQSLGYVCQLIFYLFVYVFGGLASGTASGVLNYSLSYSVSLLSSFHRMPKQTNKQTTSDSLLSFLQPVAFTLGDMMCEHRNVASNKLMRVKQPR